MEKVKLDNQNKDIEIRVSGGNVIDVVNIPKGIRVKILDFDVMDIYPDPESLLIENREVYTEGPDFAEVLIFESK